MSMKEQRKKKKVLIILIVLAIVIITFFYIISTYTVTNVSVTGNTRYSEDEIIEYVVGSDLGMNSLYLMLKNRFGSSEEIPFIDKVDVKIISANEVKIVVYEKNIVGYIEYMGSYMYFDKDGIVVESSTEIIEGVPRFTGISFDYIVLYQKIPVEDESIFTMINELTKVLNKYEVSVDKVNIDREINITMYKDNIKILLGQYENLTEKIIDLPSILPSLNGLSGTLHMEDYDEDSKISSFIAD